MADPTVAVIILNYNGAGLLAANLPAVVAAVENSPFKTQLVVADNGSSDGSAAVVKKFPQARWLALGRNWGFGEGNNRAIKKIKVDIVVLLNSDIQPARDFLAPLVAALKDNIFAATCWQDVKTKTDSFIGGAAVGYWSRGLVRHRSLTLAEQKRQTSFDTFYASGGASAFWRDKFLALGGFSPRFKPFYWEDADLGLRAWQRGWRSVFVPQSKVIHRHESTVSQVAPSWRRQMIGWRGQLLLTWEMLDDGWLWLNHIGWLPLHLLGALASGQWFKLAGFGLALGHVSRGDKNKSQLTTRQIFQRSQPPKLVLISETIRRDLQRPLQRFRQFEVVHFYRHASYGDMEPADFTHPRAVQFTSCVDLYRKLKTERPTILQLAEPAANRVSFFASLTGLLYWYWHRPKIVLPVFENRSLRERLSGVKYYLSAWLTRQVAQAADAIFVLNAGARKNLLALDVSKSKMQQLLWGSWGIDVKEFSSSSKIISEPKILFVGRVARAKGIPQLLAAFKIVKRQIPRVKLIVAGPKGDASDLLINQPGVRSLGPVKNNAVPALLCSARVVAMPSQTTKFWEEQVGMVGLQALACGVPLVATRSGAIPEYFPPKSGAVLVEEQDILALARALIKFLSDLGYYKETRRKGIAYIKQNFEVQRQISQIEQFLDKI